MSDRDRILVTLGLTGALTGAVSCGPCLKIAVPDSGDDTDTGDTGDTGGQDAPDADTRADASARVLARGVLPQDVVEILKARQK
jgi:hypothetical protein